MNDSKASKMVVKRQVTEAVDDPSKIFTESWYRDSAFCRGFFDR